MIGIPYKILLVLYIAILSVCKGYTQENSTRAEHSEKTRRTKTLGTKPELRADSTAFKHAEARERFNNLLSKDHFDTATWILAIQNELSAKTNATALGLANKALSYTPNHTEIERLRQLAIHRILARQSGLAGHVLPNEKKALAEDSRSSQVELFNEPENLKPRKKDALPLKNLLTTRNLYTAFSRIYDPLFFSGIAFQHRTKFGLIIPGINYANRFKMQGLQYELTLYPKFSEKVYAFINYGYSNASIYPNHNFAGDLYLALPKNWEVSGGGRHVLTPTNQISSITNSVGYYYGNYYVSLRSYITPQPERLTQISGNILLRKYLRDAENYVGLNFGIGFTPEIRQLTSGGELLAETLLFIESQRLRLEYQFSSKTSRHIYETNLGLQRQELVFDSGNFVWAVSAGLTYSIKF